MSLLDTSSGVIGFIESLFTGTPDQMPLNTDLARQVIQAGGSESDVQAAVTEQNNFLNNTWPVRSPFKTLTDVATGDPLGTGKSDYTALIILGVALLAALYFFKAVLK